MCGVVGAEIELRLGRRFPGFRKNIRVMDGDNQFNALILLWVRYKD